MPTNIGIIGTNIGIIHKLITSWSMNTIKLLTTHSRAGHSLEDTRLLWPRLPDKSIKTTLFHFTQIFVSTFLFNTGEHSSGFNNRYKILTVGQKLFRHAEYK